MAPRLQALALAALLAGRVALGEDAVGLLVRQELATARVGLHGEGHSLPAGMRGGERRLDIDPNQRHASAHLRYQQPDTVAGQAQSWYMTLTPKHSSEDTYFSVLGNSLGYMGLQQVEERGMWFQGKAVFSIWDQGCAHIMDPSACPESQRAEIVECGRHAICTTFGGEGTGLKSYINFHEWDLEQQYGFLIQVFDEGNGKARQEGYFHAPELEGWILMAKLRVNIGNKPWQISGQYSFVEQWSTRSSEDIRFARFGNSFMEPASAAPGDWNWVQVMRATFSHTNGPNEVTTNVHGNVTDGGRQWGLGTGGDLQRGLHDGDLLQITVAAQTYPADLTDWVQIRLNNQLPGGCLGQTCLDTKIAAWFKSALTKEYIPITIIVLLVLSTCLLACCYQLIGARMQGKAMRGGSPATQYPQRAQPMMSPASEQLRHGYEQPRYGYEQAAGTWGGRGNGPAGRPQALERQPLVQMAGRAR